EHEILIGARASGTMRGMRLSWTPCSVAVWAILVGLASPAWAAPPAAASPRAADSFDGSWWGTLDFGVQKLRLVIKLSHAGAVWHGELASPDQGPGSKPADEVTVAGDTLKFAMRA